MFQPLRSSMRATCACSISASESPTAAVAPVRLQRQVAGAHGRRRADDHRPLDRVGQLAHVARPVVAHEQVERLRLDLAERPVHLRGEALDEVPGQAAGCRRAARAAAGSCDGDDVDAVVEVLAERALLDQPLQVLVGRADHAEVDLHRLRPARRATNSFVSSTRSRSTCVLRTDRADLVEEQRAAVGHLELALAPVLRAGERALLVAEQLALEQALGQRAAVDRHDGKVPPRAGGVDRPRDELLAGAALAADQHGRVGPRHRGDQLEHLAHRCAVADDLRRPGELCHVLAQLRRSRCAAAAARSPGAPGGSARRDRSAW